jgi:hypothetical protein
MRSLQEKLREEPYMAAFHALGICPAIGIPAIKKLDYE